MKKVFYFVLAICCFVVTAEARRGCCSHHGGISHCDPESGYYQCKDGTLSPTCQCPIQQTKKAKKEKKSNK
jgi:hypothetical protein